MKKSKFTEAQIAFSPAPRWGRNVGSRGLPEGRDQRCDLSHHWRKKYTDLMPSEIKRLRQGDRRDGACAMAIAGSMFCSDARAGMSIRSGSIAFTSWEFGLQLRNKTPSARSMQASLRSSPGNTTIHLLLSVQAYIRSHQRFAGPTRELIMVHLTRKSAVYPSYRKTIVAVLVSLPLLAFLQNIWLAWHFPVYADEMLYRMMLGRFLRDGGVSINSIPHCGEVGFTLAVPYWMIPFRLAEEVIYGRDFGLLHVREIGVALHVASIASLITIFWVSIDKTASKLLAIIVVLCFIGVGSLPFLLVMNRPELLIRIVVALWVLWPFVTRKQQNRRLVGQVLAAICVILIPFAAIASVHIKSMLFVPVALTSLWFLVRNSWLRMIGAALLLLMAVSAFRYWTTRLACPDVPSVEGLVGQGLNPAQLLADPVNFLWSALINLANFPTYWTNVLFADAHTSQWLPPTAPSVLSSLASASVAITFSALVATTLIGSLAALMRGIRSKTLDKSAAIILSLTASLTIVTTGSITKYFVESPLMLPLLGLSGWLGVYQLSGAIRKGVMGVLVASLGAAWGFSQVMLINNYTPYVATTWSVHGYTPNQAFSFNFANYEQTRSEILRAAKQCDIDPDKMPRHLIVDDLTYPAMKKAFQPFTVYYVVTSWPGSQEDLARYLKRVRSAGLIASCSFLAPSLAPYAKQTDHYCCVGDFGQLGVPDPVP
jgi:hypothetical protein